MSFIISGAQLGWLPSDLGSTLKGWYRLDLSKVTLNGSTISSIIDLSGNGNTLTQGTVGDQPTWNASDADFGGNGSMTLASDYMIANGLSSVQNGNDLPMTIMMVLTQVTGSGQYHWGWGDSIDNANFHTTQIVVDGGNFDWEHQRMGVSAKTIDNTPISTDPPFVVAWTFTGTTASMWWDNVKHLDGVSLDTASLNVDEFFIGALPFGGVVSGKCSAKYNEIVVCDSVLSDSELAQFYNYAVMRNGL